MTLDELKIEVKKYQYFDDDSVIDVALASIVATILQLGDPLWIIVIGPSSGGKSQLLRPLSLTNKKFMHRIDDITENTFLSGIKSSKSDFSLLHRIGKAGMLVISDLTVIFSKNSEAKTAILSQFRMLYDGEMVKHSGSSDKAITWKGYLGVLAGSTPSIYRHFEEVADMGERFIYYRMKGHDDRAAAKTALRRKQKVNDTDDILGDLYKTYLKETIEANRDKGIPDLPEWIEDRILTIAQFAEKIRTPTHMNFRETYINRIPISAFSARVALQLGSLSRGLMLLRKGELTEYDAKIIEWCGWSLANEEKRACLKVLASYPFDVGVPTQTVADKIGLATEATNFILQGMAAVKVLKRTGDSSNLYWNIASEDDWKLIQSITGETTQDLMPHRELSAEEMGEMKDVANAAFDNFGK